MSGPAKILRTDFGGVTEQGGFPLEPLTAIIPVAGMGTRLRPHTHTQPKALMHVAGKPILAHILDALLPLPLQRVVLVVGYLGEKVEEYVREHYCLPVHFVTQEVPLGNGHAIYVAREFLGEGPVMIVMGDTIVKADLQGMARLAHSALAVREVPDPRRFGVVVLDKEGFVRRIVEKPEEPVSHLALVGVYFIRNAPLLGECLERLIREDRRVRGEYWLADALQLMVEAGERIQIFPIQGWFDCGTAEALLQANRDLLEGDPPDAPRLEDAVVFPPSFVHPQAVVRNSVIGPYVSIAEGAQVTESIIRDSIINAHARVHRVLLEGSIIGENAVVTGQPSRINLGDSSVVELA